MVEFNKIDLYARYITGSYAHLPSQLLRFGAMPDKTHAELNNKPMLEYLELERFKNTQFYND